MLGVTLMPKLLSKLIKPLVCIALCFSFSSLNAQEAASPNQITPSQQAQLALDNGDVATALRIYRQKAFAGELWAQLTLGQINLNGVLVPQSIVNAVDWYTRAAVRGSAVAQYRVALIYCDEQNTALSRPAKCLDWLSRSADQGFAPALYQLAIVAYQGNFGQGNLDLALQLATQASEAGIEDANELHSMITKDLENFKRKATTLTVEEIDNRFKKTTSTIRLGAFENYFDMQRLVLNTSLKKVDVYQVGNLNVASYGSFKTPTATIAAIKKLPLGLQSLNPQPVKWETIKTNLQANR
jgi:hypothetical protein